MVVIMELLVVSIGLMISVICLLMLEISFWKYGIGFSVFLLRYILIMLMCVFGMFFSILFIILRFVCRIGIMVIFLFLIWLIFIGLF